jgi:hypothetical protein
MAALLATLCAKNAHGGGVRLAIEAWGGPKTGFAGQDRDPV